MKLYSSNDRIFSVILILLVSAYGFFAVFEISAPIQYDPLGPEGWPRFLTVIALLLCLSLLRAPQENRKGAFSNLRQVLLAAVLLAAYALLFEALGFALATAVFCTALATILGARPLQAVLFGGLAGLGLYACAIYLLGLNLPLGEIFLANGAQS